MAKRKLDPQNFHTIYYWMSRLTTKRIDKNGIPVEEPLSGVPKEVYAIIYRFSVGRNGCCNMSYDEFSTVTGASTSTIIRALKLLVSSGLILEDCHTTGERDRSGRVIITSKFYRANIEPLKQLEDELEIPLTIELKANEKKPTEWNDYSKSSSTDNYMQSYFEKHKRRDTDNKVY